LRKGDPWASGMARSRAYGQGPGAGALRTPFASLLGRPLLCLEVFPSLACVRVRAYARAHLARHAARVLSGGETTAEGTRLLSTAPPPAHAFALLCRSHPLRGETDI
jgi:hypothetical protein